MPRKSKSPAPTGSGKVGLLPVGAGDSLFRVCHSIGPIARQSTGLNILAIKLI